MKKYEELLIDVLPEVPGCPPELAIREIRYAAMEFCEKTLIHQVTLDPISLKAGLSTYDIDAPDGHRVERIMKAWCKDKELTPVAPDMIPTPEGYNAKIPGVTVSKGTPVAYTQPTVDTAIFLPIPDQDYRAAVTMRVALVPLRTSTEFEDFIFEQWGEAIACGAKARLMITPGKPYSNTEAAGLNQQRYVSGVNDARQSAVRGYVRSSLRVKLRGNP